MTRISARERASLTVQRGRLWRGLQVVSAISWLLLTHLGLSWLVNGYVLVTRPIDQSADMICFFALPVLTLFACLSFFFDTRVTRAGVWPSNFLFLILSLIPSAMSAWVIIMFAVILIDGPLVQ